MSSASQSDTSASDDVQAVMLQMGADARAAMRPLSLAITDAKNKALSVAASELRAHTADIIEANAKDMAAGEARGMSKTLLDRLMLDAGRVEGIAQALEDIVKLTDPVGDVISQWDVPSGLNISRVRVPLGVIGIIYESRPNVTADAGALSLKAGNPAILRGGSDSCHSARAIFECLQTGLAAAGLPEKCLQLVPTTDRAAVGELLRMNQFVDVIVPRGGRSLIERVMSESRVPIFAHLEGLCHVYVDKAADLEMARKITVNAKMRRTSICGAAETLLVDRAAVASHLVPLVEDLIAAGCEVRGDEETQAVDSRVLAATEEDWFTEHLDAVISVRVVDGLDEAMAHIDHYGSHHTETIITGDGATAERFLAEVDSAILLHNASTQYADGGEFGMGAEIGISTGRMHARGPVGVEQLTTFKYVVRGDGQARP
jgi:glutamate-5-semialdehyde dehydrogenase